MRAFRSISSIFRAASSSARRITFSLAAAVALGLAAELPHSRRSFSYCGRLLSM